MDTITFTVENTIKNTYDDWGLIPISGVKPPEIRGNKRYFYSTFISRNNYSDFKNFIDKNQELDAEFSLDPDYVYHGKWKIVNTEKRSNGYHVTLSGILDEFKMEKKTINSDWKWDEMNFDTGVIATDLFKNKFVNSTEAFQSIGLTQRQIKGSIGDSPVRPIFHNKSESDMTFKVNGVELVVPAGTKMYSIDIMLDPNTENISIQVKGNGYYDISFRKGVR